MLSGRPPSITGTLASATRPVRCGACAPHSAIDHICSPWFLRCDPHLITRPINLNFRATCSSFGHNRMPQRTRALAQRASESIQEHLSLLSPLQRQASTSHWFDWSHLTRRACSMRQLFSRPHAHFHSCFTHLACPVSRPVRAFCSPFWRRRGGFEALGHTLEHAAGVAPIA